MSSWDKYWVWSLTADELERLLERDARHEHPFVKFCIREAMINRRVMETKKSEGDILEEDLF